MITPNKIKTDSSAFAGNLGFDREGMRQSCFGAMSANTIGKARPCHSLKGEGRSPLKLKADAVPTCPPKLNVNTIQRRRATTRHSGLARWAPLLKVPLTELISRANTVRKRKVGNKLELCSIVSAKSGLCNEDCKFCAQSSRHKTKVPTYSLKSSGEMIEAAIEARRNGASRFGIVTSGNRLTSCELKTIAQAISEIRKRIGIAVCGSLGALGFDELTMLKSAGLTRYHHNIETSRRFYRKIVSTHSFEERIDTIKGAKLAGLEICSGGIIGMGETWQDRIDMAYLLKYLDVDSVPLNILVPIKGTPLESVKPISPADVIRTICIFRIILGDKIIKIAAGRETVLKDLQAMGFMAGANGMLIGGYLTIKGRSLEEDRLLAREIKILWKE
ncbi:MAG: biotin synthase BioB [Candidatus Omnitrophota bacterium]